MREHWDGRSENRANGGQYRGGRSHRSSKIENADRCRPRRVFTLSARSTHVNCRVACPQPGSRPRSRLRRPSRRLGTDLPSGARGWSPNEEAMRPGNWPARRSASRANTTCVPAARSRTTGKLPKIEEADAEHREVACSGTPTLMCLLTSLKTPWVVRDR